MKKNYVKKYKGHKVPEGSQRVLESFMDFYKMEDGIIYFYSTFRNDWEEPGDAINYNQSIELPKVEPDIDWPNAPSDAAVWITPFNPNYTDGWYRKSGVVYMRFSSGGDWSVSDEGLYFTVHHRPMDYKNPLLKNKAAGEWVDGLPPIGCSVLLNITNEDAFLFSCNGNTMITIPNNTELVVIGHCIRHDNKKTCATLMAKDCNKYKGFTTINPDFLSPIKTQEEKDKESFDKAVFKELYKIETILDRVGDRAGKENAIAKVLFEAGFTAPKDDE